MLKEKQHLEKTITLNGNCVLRRLSHSRGSPQGTPGPEIGIWGTLVTSEWGLVESHRYGESAGLGLTRRGESGPRT